jgi:predicted AAA+ superfamily ATPase
VFTFNLSDEKPSKEKVYRTLIDEARTDHHWFKFIEKFADYKQYESVVYIHKIISKFLRDLIEQKFIMQDINTIKN